MIDIDTEIKEAMLRKGSIRLSVLRALKTAIGTTLSTKGRNGKPLTPDEEISIIRKQIAQRAESIVQWEKAGRTEQASTESAEKAILESFLPAEMSDKEISELVKQAIIESNASTKKDMGKAIAYAKELGEGRVDPKELSKLIGARLV